MCGINGIFGLEQLSDPAQKIAAMNAALKHRGPDAEGTFTGKNVILGHKRLSVIAPGHAADQPFTDHSGRYTLIFNGEIYNYRELKSQLHYPFSTSSDTEVLLAAYIEWQEKCLEKLNGMFAFAVWDNELEELFIARDRIGIKPLYYANVDNSFIFSSEIRALLATEMIARQANPESVFDYLRYQTVQPPYTIINGVFVLPAGHFMKITPEDTSVKSYWDPTLQVVKGLASIPYGEITSYIGRKLHDSVKLRMVSDVPMGAFLSGGIDSSAVVGLMSSESSGPVSTFNVSFGDSPYSEAVYAREVAEKFGTRHTEVELTTAEFLDSIPMALAAMDHPSGDGPNTYVVSKAAKEAGITVAFSGLGGDELFAGYDFFSRSLQLVEKKWMLSFPKWSRKLAATVVTKNEKSVAAEKIRWALSLDYFDVEYLYQIHRQVSPDKNLLPLMTLHQAPQNRILRTAHDAMGYGTEGFRLPWLSKISYAEMLTNLQSVLLRDTDQMSMASALEVRVPFLDHRVVEFVLGVPDKYKLGNSPKKLLIDSLPDLLPESVVNRPKMGFTFPWQQWMQKELKTFCAERLMSLGKRDYMNEKAIQQRWDRFLANDPRVNWSRIWYLVVLEDWLHRNGIE